MQQDDPRRKNMSPFKSTPHADPAPMDQRTKDVLGHALQSHYDDLVKAPIPDRFLVLLAQLDAKEARDE
jgi:Anti-sigma factor NepR